MSTVEQHRPSRVAPSKADVDAARALARAVGLEYVDLDRYPLNAAAKGLLSEQLARRHHVLAVGWKYGTPVIAVATPGNMLVMDDVRTAAGRDIHAVVACMSQIDAYIDRMYSKPASRGPVNGTKRDEPPEPAHDAEPAQQGSDGSPDDAPIAAGSEGSSPVADESELPPSVPEGEADAGSESARGVEDDEGGAARPRAAKARAEAEGRGESARPRRRRSSEAEATAEGRGAARPRAARSRLRMPSLTMAELAKPRAPTRP